MIRKDLFLHDLAVVAILKDEGHYLKEWLDYHLLAGVNHFYLYDNDSTDNQAEVAAPYVKAGLVDYIHFPGKVMQMPAYNDAVKKFKFHCRYMAFIDLDEFIYPKSLRSIVEVVDEILLQNLNAAGLKINWQCFGSNGHDKADYSRGVLERFTRRAPNAWFLGTLERVEEGNIFVKFIANPRRVDYISDPHSASYLESFYDITENGKKFLGGVVYPVNTEKIVVNHYYLKSREEFMIKKMPRGWPCSGKVPYNHEQFVSYDRNEVFDDGILKYRAARAENFSLENDAEKFNRVIEALTETLSDYAAGKTFSLETALTCRALSTNLREKFPNDSTRWRVYEEASLAAILKSLYGMNFTDARLLIRELPILLSLPYSCVEEIRRDSVKIISWMKDTCRLNDAWKTFFELDYLQDILKLT